MLPNENTSDMWLSPLNHIIVDNVRRRPSTLDLELAKLVMNRDGLSRHAGARRRIDIPLAHARAIAARVDLNPSGW
jgi:hypothetical protein